MRAWLAIFCLTITVQSHGEENSMTEIPRPEHPRPDFRRGDWLNLNGTWAFEFDPDDQGREERWYESEGRLANEITVPFPWESALSGIERPDYRGIAWYSRSIRVPRRWGGKRIFIVFGAVDYSAEVWLDGKHLGSHKGGYTPFEFEITDLVEHGAEHRVTVRAEDLTDHATPTGKQVRWYTPSSGIWQTVYLEARGSAYISSLRPQPDSASGETVFRLGIRSATETGATVRIESLDSAFDTAEGAIELAPGENETEITARIGNPRLWSPDSPTLYPFRVVVVPSEGEGDSVVSYFAFREIGVGTWGDDPTPRILLNGKPVYIRGALHQAFHPDGLYSYPSEEVLKRDLEMTRAFGLNCLRVHIKVEEPLFYSWADRLGVLILYDLPNFWTHLPEARERWEAMLREAVERDSAHPSIVSWVLFNETWGLDDGEEGYSPDRQAWVERMFRLAKDLDPTRPVEDNSPNRRDHVVTDLNSWHFYIDDYEKAREHIADAVKNVHPGSGWNYVEGRTQGEEPFFNSEYGAVSAGGGDRDIAWGMKYLTSELRKYPKIQGYIYTELSDIEWEHNGIVNYDRSAKEFGYDEFVTGYDISDVHSPDFIVLDAPPYAKHAPGTEVTIPVFFSSFSEDRPRKFPWTWKIVGEDRFGEEKVLDQGTGTIDAPPYTVTGVGEIRVKIPEERMLMTLSAAVMGRNGRREAVNYVHLDVDAPAPRQENVEGKGTVLRVSPNDFASASDPDSQVPGKVFFTGTGFVEYEMAIPGEIDPATVEEIVFFAEFAAKAGDEKLDWPERRKDQDYPQTDGKKHPGDVLVAIDGTKVTHFDLPDDPADARGVFSHAAATHHGSYGYLKELKISRQQFPNIFSSLKGNPMLRIRLEVPEDADPKGGLAIFGETMGRHPIDPTVILR